MLDRLPEAQRHAVKLTKYSGYTLEETAELTQSSVGAVKQRLSRAYSNLRKLTLGERGTGGI